MLRLTPHGSLQWCESGELLDSGALFALTADKEPQATDPSLYYWQKLTEKFLAKLCHLPEESATFHIEQLPLEELYPFMLAAPPMEGGEYLSLEVLFKVWEGLNQWVQAEISREGSLATFLQRKAPKWHQLGRVCFHLAENKQGELPFAFLVTYTSNFNESGRVSHIPLKKALEQSTETKNKSFLLKLLTPIQKAAERCPWVQELIDSNQIYHPAFWSPLEAYQLLQSVSLLEESGLAVRIPNWWKQRPRPVVKVTIGEEKKTTLGASALLDFNITAALGDQSLSKADLEILLSGNDGLVFFKGQWVEVDKNRLKEALSHWNTLYENGKNGLSFIEGMRLLAGAPSDLKDNDTIEIERDWVHVGAGTGLREILTNLREPSRLTPPQLKERLQGTLRPYQQEGVAWLNFLTELGLGACLADDMGLGKTVQILSLLLCKQSPGSPRKPSLLVVPASLLANWANEAKRFTPSLKLLFVHPSEMDQKQLNKLAASAEAALKEVDLVVTTYSLLGRYEWLTQVDWNLVILDEAQAIKNPGTTQTKAVKKLNANARVAMTGTPVENRMGDLWSLFDFLNPGLLGSGTLFKTFIKMLQERSTQQYAPLKQLVSPYILRRMKTNREIIQDLPDKTETISYCPLSKEQAKLYQQIVSQMSEALETAKGIARKGIVLQTLMRLKQVCNHPHQLSGAGGYEEEESGKFQRLTALCEELAERQERVLVFTQFKEIIDPLAEHLSRIFKRKGLILHGSTAVAKRKELVEQFQKEDGPPFFILSLKAGGTGLNLTQASHVIHFDRWWNPAVENQATDRAFRIGQKRNVLVHKFVTRGTIEEKIDRMISEKQQLSNEILSGEGEINLTELKDEELMNLVQLDVKQILC